VFNHNVETVPRLYAAVRPEAIYERSMAVLRRASERGNGLVKTGWMVGLGETPEEVGALLNQVAAAGVNLVTIGQYLRPSKNHLPVVEYVSPDVFAGYQAYGETLGLQVHSAPFVRSSFQAGETYARAAADRGPAACGSS
jgi:lipoic acid synthetase